MFNAHLKYGLFIAGREIAMEQEEQEESCVRSFVTAPVLTKGNMWRACNK
jgi:hypothetical protein